MLHLTELVVNLRHHGKGAYQNTAHLALEMYQAKALQIANLISYVEPIQSHTLSHSIHHIPICLIRPCDPRLQVESNEACPIPKKELWLDLDNRPSDFLKKTMASGPSSDFIELVDCQPQFD